MCRVLPGERCRGNGWSLAWHLGEGWAEKVLPKHGLLLTEIRIWFSQCIIKPTICLVGVAQWLSVDP